MPRLVYHLQLSTCLGYCEVRRAVDGWSISPLRNAEFSGYFAEHGGHHRTAQSSMASVRWVHGTLERPVACEGPALRGVYSCAGCGEQLRATGCSIQPMVMQRQYVHECLDCRGRRAANMPLSAALKPATCTFAISRECTGRPFPKKPGRTAPFGIVCTYRYLYCTTCIYVPVANAACARTRCI
jgi:hypothetical protein